MFKFFKNKNFVKFYILIGISIFIFCSFLIIKNFQLKNNNNFETNKISTSFISKYENFFEIKKIILNGRANTNLNSIKEIVNSSILEDQNLIRYDAKNLKEELKKLNWINNISIRKIFPNQIIINVNEHKQFAIFNKNKKKFLVSEEGKIIYEIKNAQIYDLIELENVLALKNINEIKNFLFENPDLKKKISKITVTKNNRWDLTINKILFKLPNKNKNEAIKEIKKFSNLKNIEMVDLRFFEKKIFLKTNKKKVAMKEKK